MEKINWKNFWRHYASLTRNKNWLSLFMSKSLPGLKPKSIRCLQRRLRWKNQSRKFDIALPLQNIKTISCSLLIKFYKPTFTPDKCSIGQEPRRLFRLDTLLLQFFVLRVLYDHFIAINDMFNAFVVNFNSRSGFPIQIYAVRSKSSRITTRILPNCSCSETCGTTSGRFFFIAIKHTS